MSWVEVFRDGGPFVYVVLLTFLAVPVAVVARAAAAAMGWRVPQALWLSIGVVPLAVGLLGTGWGAHLALRAVAHASPEVAPILAAHGLGISLYTTMVGALATAAAFLGLGAAGGAHGLAASPESSEAQQAVERVAMPQYLALATASAGFAVCTWMVAGRFHALATAPAELRRTLMEQATAALPTVASTTGFLTFLFVVGAFAATATSWRALASLRVALGAMACAAVLGGPALLGLVSAERLLTLNARIATYEQTRLDDLLADDVRLPTVPAPLGQLLSPRPTLRLEATGRLSLDGAPLGDPALLPDAINLEADVRAPLQALRPLAARLTEVDVHVVVHRHTLRALPLPMRDASADDLPALGLVGRDGAWELMAMPLGAGSPELLARTRRSELPHTVREVTRAQRDRPAPRRIAVWPPPNATMQDLLGLLPDLVPHEGTAPLWMEWHLSLRPEARAGSLPVEVLSGDLRPALLQAGIARYANDLAYCDRRDRSGGTSDVLVQFDVLPDGSVGTAQLVLPPGEVVDAPTQDPVRACVLGRFRSMKGLPGDPHGATVRAQYRHRVGHPLTPSSGR